MVRIELAGFEGVTAEGCPVAKWVISRSSKMEKYIVVYKARPNHLCAAACTAAAILIFDAVEQVQCAEAYSIVTKFNLQNLGSETSRGCSFNTEKSCRCQGLDEEKAGRSYTFGCSWSVHRQGCCKFAKSTGEVRKFKLAAKVSEEEEKLEQISNRLADSIGKIHARLAPECHANMALFGDHGCRIGEDPEKAYSGVTTVVDFCAHPHNDTSNMIGGCTAILTLTKEENRVGQGTDQQFHCLPLYTPQGSTEELAKMEAEGGFEILREFRKKVKLVHLEPAPESAQDPGQILLR